MSVLITEANESDIADIDHYLQRAEGAVAYHNIRWLKAVKAAYHNDYRYLVARDGAAVVGVFPICLFKPLSGRAYLCSLPYCDMGGPVAVNDEVRSLLIKKGLEIARTLSCETIEIREQEFQNIEEGVLENQKVSMVLQLPSDAEELMKGFKSKLRSQIRKAEKNSLEFEAGNSAELVKEFFHVFSRNMHVLGSPTHSVKWFECLASLFGSDLVIGVVRLDAQVIGAGIILFNGDKVSIPWASTLREFNRLAPNMLLYWNMLRISCERACNEFDFGRSTYMGGTYKFKQQWGATPRLLNWKSLDSTGKLKPTAVTSSTGNVRRLVENTWKKLPLPVVNFFGPIVRKRISL